MQYNFTSFAFAYLSLRFLQVVMKRLFIHLGIQSILFSDFFQR